MAHRLRLRLAKSDPDFQFCSQLDTRSCQRDQMPACRGSVNPYRQDQLAAEIMKVLKRGAGQKASY
jgi:hypothetical protein